MTCFHCGREVAADSIFCEYCGTQLVKTPTVTPGLRQRNGFISFWLWLMVIGGLLATIIYGYAASILLTASYVADYLDEYSDGFLTSLLSGYDEYEVLENIEFLKISMVAQAVISFLMIIGAMMMLNWKKAGFGVVVVAAILSYLITCGEVVIYHGDTTLLVTTMVGTIISILILYGILHIRKNRVSCWSLME